MTYWPVRSGAFAAGPPIATPAIRAQDVILRLGPKQEELLSASAKKRATTIVPIGGDYWVDTPYPVGPPSSAPWVSSAFKASLTGPLPEREGEDLVGMMSSVPFVLDGAFLRMFLGGDDDPAVGVELFVKPAAARDLSTCDRPSPQSPRWTGPPEFVLARTRRRAHSDLPERDGLDRVEVPLGTHGCDVRGLTAILRVFDQSRSAHINVGTFGLADAPLTDAEKQGCPVWGLADYHTHPTDYLALGGLQGVHTIWGAPGGAMREYVGDPAVVNEHFARDIPACDDPTLPFNGHQGGLAAPIMINAAEGRLAPSIDDLKLGKLTFDHASNGGPLFTDFPDFRAGAHEQYHITQIYRAYLGGLRLMSALAIHNRGLEYGMGWVRCGDNGNPTVDTTPDWTVIRAHVRAMKQLAELNSEWMEIAYSPEEARRIIRANKLAVVLGIEVPQLGLDQDGSPEEQVRALEALGIRQAILVHGMDNFLGGTALFQDLYNSVNDWMYRPGSDRVETLSGVTVWTQYPAAFYEVTSAPSPPAAPLPFPETMDPTERILFRLGNPLRVVLTDLYPRPPSYDFLGNRFGKLHPLVGTTFLGEKEQDLYDQSAPGHRNVRGLTGRGAEFIWRLIQHGMLIDLAHMSDATVVDSENVVRQTCGDYPVMISHAHFRPLAMKVDYSDLAADFVDATGAEVRADLLAQRTPMNACIRDHSRCDQAVLQQALNYAARAERPGTTIRENLPREFDIPSSEVQQVRQRQGVIGVFIGQGAIDPASLGPDELPGGLTTLPIPLNCAASSQGLGATLLFMNARMKGMGGIGLASDYTFTASMAPRFGDNACAGYMAAGTSSGTGAQLLETLLDPDHYRFDEQKDAVNYASSAVATCTQGRSKKPGIPCGDNAPLDAYSMGNRTYDYNVDGFAHYGLVPDALQDVANQLHEARHLALDGVFRSAQAYLEMWSKARQLSKCEANGLCPEPARAPDPQCQGRAAPGDRTECGYSCPCGWNHGAPLHEVSEVWAACDPGKPVSLPVMDPHGATPTQLKYAQRRADLAVAGDLALQGDWAVFRIQQGQTWTCGDGPAHAVGCPDVANYVKVRRVLDTTVSPVNDRCDYVPLPPEDGNRSVLFQCLVGPAGADMAATRPRSPRPGALLP